jgi:hypothetical protein
MAELPDAEIVVGVAQEVSLDGRQVARGSAPTKRVLGLVLGVSLDRCIPRELEWGFPDDLDPQVDMRNKIDPPYSAT